MIFGIGHFEQGHPEPINDISQMSLRAVLPIENRGQSTKLVS